MHWFRAWLPDSLKRWKLSFEEFRNNGRWKDYEGGDRGRHPPNESLGILSWPTKSGSENGPGHLAVAWAARGRVHL
jgi:hypothetical protein